MSKLSKGILFLFMIVISGVLLTGCSLVRDDPQNSESKECYGKGKQVEGNPSLSAVITNAADNLESDQREFAISELNSFEFGMFGEKGSELYYGTYELCDLQTGDYLEKGEYVYENWTMFEQVTTQGVTESSGNTTSFTYEVDGVEELFVPGPGKYAVYTFSSNGDGAEWKLSDSLEFTVTE